MFNVKVFADYSTASITNNQDQRFLKVLVGARKATNAKYVNFSIFEYQNDTHNSVHFITYPIGWASYYIENHCADHDPFLKIDFRQVHALDWDDLRKNDKQSVIGGQLRQFALGNKGMSVRVHCGGSLYGVLSMTFQCDPGSWTKFKQDNLDLFRFEADRLCSRHFDIYDTMREPDTVLTPREREVLQLVALGRTDEQVARLIGIGKWTVVSHMQSAKYKLDCSNRAAAVAKAVAQGLIDVKYAV